MNTQTQAQEELQRIPQTDPEVPERIPAIYIPIKCDLAYMAQQQPEMTDEELLLANSALGGFNWLDDADEENDY